MTAFQQYNVRMVAEALGRAGPFRPFPPGDDRNAWTAIAATAGSGAVDMLRMRAASDRDAQIERLPVSLYLDFERTGRRELYEDRMRAMRNRLYRLVIAECIAWQGDNLDAISDLIWARLEDRNWSWPAHARGIDAPDHPTVDLAAAMTAEDLAEIDYLLGNTLDPMLRRHLRAEVDRRCITPFLERHDHWWLGGLPDRPLNNWTAVCVNGVVGAACYLEPNNDRLAEIISRGLPALAEYLKTFDSRGGSTEGPDYWSYGFGNYVVLAHLLEARTDGALRLLDDPAIPEIARFPLRTLIGRRKWASFSDADEWGSFAPGLLRYLSDRMDLPELEAIGFGNDFDVDHVNQFVWPLRQYAWPVREPASPFVPEKRDWFPDMMWMFARLDPADPAAMQLAVKGGHNGEMHNQNDVGSFIVTVGGEAVVTDPGRGLYSKAYFSPDRYQNIAASSLGHSVPVVAGREQVPGRSHAAKLIEHAQTEAGERMVLDLTGVYDAETGLAELERTIAFDRTGTGAVTLRDRFAFADGPAPFESVLVTVGTAEIAPGRVTLSRNGASLAVEYDDGTLQVRTDIHADIPKQHAPPMTITRVIFSPRVPSPQGEIALSIHS